MMPGLDREEETEMKPLQLIAIIGALAVASLGGWYLYMRSTPMYEKAPTRGLDPKLLPPPSSAAPATVGAVSAAPTEAAAASAPATATPSAAPTAP
jgi:hypothetical protein